ncbi:DNA primase [Symbiobacterium thermophilum]|uniref:DNA primase n=1 Tax=Symbiobacterium thermophilum TaxID=2734 RepID=A0A953I6F8_SYMTR|nr:DNA primase [Symbiobacterium thermophilum]MBY6277737.1 DNA primase [Symbiobacterium thermophilum]
MARFDQAFKDEVRARNDIVEVISAYVKLERRGNRYVGLCPFHSEKTPSFHVVPDGQFYYCFGCKASGDVFTFLMEREHLTFYEALVQLAQRARIPLPQEERTPEEERAYRERRDMYAALDLAARFYHHQLFTPAGKPGLDYLLGRGLTEETIRRFRLGWAPGRGALFRALRDRFPPQILQKAGLIVPRRDGPGFMDVFFERVMFPIADLSGRVIGFGGRILGGEGAKYKNTAETPLFVKRHVLFGLDQAKEAMRARNQAILVEGYMDVLMPHQAGIQNVVAPLGTALTDEQVRIIRQQAQQVIVAFDMDTAGQLATLRGLQKLYDSGCDVRVLQLPDGKDPDEFIRTHGAPAFVERIEQALPLIEFRLSLALPATRRPTPEEMAKAVESVAQVLADVRNEVVREAYVDQVADRLAGDNPLAKPDLKLAIDRQMNRLLRWGFQHNLPDSRNNRRGPGAPASPGPTRPRPDQAPVTQAEGARRAERVLLYLLLEHPGLLRTVEAELGEEPFSDPHHRQIYRAGRALLAEADPLAGGGVIARLFDRLSDPEARQVLTEMAVKPMLTSDPEKEAADCIEKIRKHRDSRRLEDLENQIKAAAAASRRVDPAIWNEYMALVRKLKSTRS